MKNPIVTASILRRICPNLPVSIAEKIADAVEYCAPGYNMHDANILQEFIPQLAYESLYFRVRSENLNYSANRLLEVFPSKFRTLKDALPYVHNPVLMGNYVYGTGSKARLLGNITPSDGYLFRGGSYTMLTGRCMWMAYNDFIGGDVIDLTERCRNEIFWAVDASCWYFAVQKKLIAAAIKDNYIAITKGIAGCLIGLKERQRLYAVAKSLIN